MIYAFVSKTDFLFETNTFFDIFSESKTFFEHLHILSTLALFACLAVWAVMKQGNK